MTEVVPVDSNLDSPTEEERKTLGIRLINTIKEKKVSEAKSLIDRKADIAYKDKLGCQSIHHAAQHGLLDVVEKLLDAGAHPNCFDSNGQAPLHKAAGAGHVDVVIMLVAYGAVVGTMDWDGQTPFEKAVITRHVDVVEVLMSFGAEPNLQDWTWTMDEPGPKEKKLIDMIRDQIPLVTGYKYGGIDYEVVCGRPNQDMVFKKMRLVIQSVDVRNTCFMFCSKKQSEFTDLKSLLRGEEIPYSDMYEIKTWGITRKVINLTLTVEGIPKCNERIQLVSPEKDTGRVENFKKKEEDNVTEVAIIIKLHTKRPTKFALAVVSKPETFVISQEQQTIQPSNEPDAEIDIPEGTFDKAAELQLNVVETRDVNEDEADESGPLLLTNVIDMTMSDGQQPKEEIVMKLPVHHKDEEEGEMCVLATSEEDPESVDDWEVIQAQKDAKGNAVFKIDHFSMFAAASKKKVEDNKELITDAIYKSIRRERKVELRVFTSHLVTDEGQFRMIIQCGTPKKMKRKKMKKGYTFHSTQASFTVEENQTLQIRFKGMCRWKSEQIQHIYADQEEFEGSREESLENDVESLEFNGRKGFKQISIEMIILDKKCPFGTVIIEKEIHTTEECLQSVVGDKTACFRNKEHFVPTTRDVITFSVMTETEVHIVLPVKQQEAQILARAEELQEHFQDSENDLKHAAIEKYLDELENLSPSEVPAMKCQFLASIAQKMNRDEARQLGTNVCLRKTIIEKEMKKKYPAVSMLMIFRGERPTIERQDILIKALRAIDREDLAVMMENVAIGSTSSFLM